MNYHNEKKKTKKKKSPQSILVLRTECVGGGGSGGGGGGGGATQEDSVFGGIPIKSGDSSINNHEDEALFFAWQQLQESDSLVCDVVLIPEIPIIFPSSDSNNNNNNPQNTDDNEKKKAKENKETSSLSSSSFRERRKAILKQQTTRIDSVYLQSCGEDNFLMFDDLPHHQYSSYGATKTSSTTNYLASITNCHFQTELLPIEAVPSAFSFEFRKSSSSSSSSAAQEASNHNHHFLTYYDDDNHENNERKEIESYFAEVNVQMDVSQAKRMFQQSRQSQLQSQQQKQQQEEEEQEEEKFKSHSQSVGEDGDDNYERPVRQPQVEVEATEVDTRLSKSDGRDSPSSPLPRSPYPCSTLCNSNSNSSNCAASEGPVAPLLLQQQQQQQQQHQEHNSSTTTITTTGNCVSSSSSLQSLRRRRPFRRRPRPYQCDGYAAFSPTLLASSFADEIMTTEYQGLLWGGRGGEISDDGCFLGPLGAPTFAITGRRRRRRRPPQQASTVRRPSPSSVEEEIASQVAPINGGGDRQSRSMLNTWMLPTMTTRLFQNRTFGDAVLDRQYSSNSSSSSNNNNNNNNSQRSLHDYTAKHKRPIQNQRNSRGIRRLVHISSLNQSSHDNDSLASNIEESHQEEYVQLLLNTPPMNINRNINRCSKNQTPPPPSPQPDSRRFNQSEERRPSSTRATELPRSSNDDVRQEQHKTPSTLSTPMIGPTTTTTTTTKQQKWPRPPHFFKRATRPAPPRPPPRRRSDQEMLLFQELQEVALREEQIINRILTAMTGLGIILVAAFLWVLRRVLKKIRLPLQQQKQRILQEGEKKQTEQEIIESREDKEKKNKKTSSMNAGIVAATSLHNKKAWDSIMKAAPSGGQRKPPNDGTLPPNFKKPSSYLSPNRNSNNRPRPSPPSSLMRYSKNKASALLVPTGNNSKTHHAIQAAAQRTISKRPNKQVPQSRPVVSTSSSFESALDGVASAASTKKNKDASIVALDNVTLNSITKLKATNKSSSSKANGDNASSQKKRTNSGGPPTFQKVDTGTSTSYNTPITENKVAIRNDSTSYDTEDSRVANPGGSFIEQLKAARLQPTNSATRKGVKSTCTNKSASKYLPEKAKIWKGALPSDHGESLLMSQTSRQRKKELQGSAKATANHPPSPSSQQALQENTGPNDHLELSPCSRLAKQWEKSKGLRRSKKRATSNPLIPQPLVPPDPLLPPPDSKKDEPQAEANQPSLKADPDPASMFSPFSTLNEVVDPITEAEREPNTTAAQKKKLLYISPFNSSIDTPEKPKENSAPSPASTTVSDGSFLDDYW